MAGLLETGFLVQFAVEGRVVSTSGTNRKIVNSFVYGLPDRPLSFTTKAHLAANFHNQVWSGIAPLLNVSYVGQHLWVTYPNTPGDVPFDAMVPANGGSAGARLSLNQCIYGAVQTGLRTRVCTGAKRWAPVSLSDVTGDEITAAAQAAWNAAIQPMKTAIVQFEGAIAIVLFPLVWSRVLSAIDVNVPPGVGSIITAVSVNRTLGQWKHRRERVVR